jgi:hypothetical protein
MVVVVVVDFSDAGPCAMAMAEPAKKMIAAVEKKCVRLRCIDMPTPDEVF